MRCGGIQSTARTFAVRLLSFSAIAALALRAPAWVVALPPVQRLWRSWLFQLLWWYVLKPLVFTETDRFVAIATEEIALRAALPGRFTVKEAQAKEWRVWQR